jgi:hypothetical protein
MPTKMALLPNLCHGSLSEISAETSTCLSNNSASSHRARRISAGWAKPKFLADVIDHIDDAKIASAKFGRIAAAFLSS